MTNTNKREKSRKLQERSHFLKEPFWKEIAVAIIIDDDDTVGTFKYGNLKYQREWKEKFKNQQII